MKGQLYITFQEIFTKFQRFPSFQISIKQPNSRIVILQKLHYLIKRLLCIFEIIAPNIILLTLIKPPHYKFASYVAIGNDIHFDEIYLVSDLFLQTVYRC